MRAKRNYGNNWRHYGFRRGSRSWKKLRVRSRAIADAKTKLRSFEADAPKPDLARDEPRQRADTRDDLTGQALWRDLPNHAAAFATLLVAALKGCAVDVAVTIKHHST